MEMKSIQAKKIALLIPCYNERGAIGKVVRDFRRELPEADIFVYDNNSTDGSPAEAEEAGAIVRYEKRQGKGNVVRRMFKEVDSDIYIMVDGDGTYPASAVRSLIEPILNGEADMVVGSRLHPSSRSSFRWINRIGNKFFLSLLNLIFKVKITDLLSGYRAFSKRFVKGVPLLSKGFEIETELTVKAIERGYRMVEVPIDLSERAEGTRSKIKVFRDGLLILRTIFALFRDYKPLSAFGTAGLFLVICGFVPGFIVIKEFLLTGYILRIPSAILAVGLVLSGVVMIFTGIILHTISRRFQEIDIQIAEIIESINTRKSIH
jgi:glycosyltransferase involved in cell wall biosynthesis